MKGTNIVAVENAIRQFIDSVGETKIQARAQDKILAAYDDFFSELDRVSKSEFKSNTMFKSDYLILKKKKAPKGTDKTSKINFKAAYAKELTEICKRHQVLAEVCLLHVKIKQKIQIIESWNKYAKWFDWALDFGKDSYLATHVAKLSHSSSKGSSIDVRFHAACDKYSDQYLITNNNPLMDCAYPDNKYSSISQLYSIQVDGKFVGDLLSENAQDYLSSFTDDKELLKAWSLKFREMIRSENKQSYFLSKQAYFPVREGQYHLLLPLTSSSLVQDIHLQHKAYFDDEQTLARKQKSDDKYSAITVRRYPNKANLNVTGSNHSNASYLNGRRGGRIPLLASMPPQWKSKPPSYANRNSIFGKQLAYELSDEIEILRKYLVLLKNKTLSISKPTRNAAIINKLEEISSALFDHVEYVNTRTEGKNWTQNSELPIEQQLLFEPWRTDNDAAAMKLSGNWQKELSRQYGIWLNKQLEKHSKLKFTPIQTAFWSNVFAIQLREYIAIQEVEL